MDSIVYVLAGSSLGLTFRLLVKHNLKFKIGFYINNISLVNFLASFFLGIFVVLNPINNNLFLFFYVGFLGCFSTFSSFIYQLFILFQRKQFLRLLMHYIEVIVISFACFYLGFYVTQVFQK